MTDANHRAGPEVGRHRPMAAASRPDRVIRVGFTEAHGMARELSLFPPAGVRYSFLTPSGPGPRSIRSPIKGYMRRYEAGEHDLIEAIISPAITKDRWIYSCENLQAAAAFNLLGCPLPRPFRIAFLESLFRRENFKKIIFWSHAGKETLHSYGRIRDEGILGKATVVYPAIREVPDHLVRFHDREDIVLLFSGDFFRKGGVNVVNAFGTCPRASIPRSA